MDFKQIDKKAAEVAKIFFANKVRKNYYEIMALDEEVLEELRFLQEFNADQVKSLKQLREKYGREDFIKHLDEVFQNPDEIDDLTRGREILDINLDKPIHKYEFARHELNGESLKRYNVLVEMTDDMYVRLLSLCVTDKSMNMNKLRFADEDVYKHVLNRVDLSSTCDYFFVGTNPYLITMDEVKADAERIRSEYPEFNYLGYNGYTFFYY